MADEDKTKRKAPPPEEGVDLLEPSIPSDYWKQRPPEQERAPDVEPDLLEWRMLEPFTPSDSWLSPRPLPEERPEGVLPPLPPMYGPSLPPGYEWPEKPRRTVPIEEAKRAETRRAYEVWSARKQGQTPEEIAEKRTKLHEALAVASDPDLALQATEGDWRRSLGLTRGVSIEDEAELQLALRIARNIDPDKEVTIRNLAREFNVAPEIIRRDLPAWKEVKTALEIYAVANEVDAEGNYVNPITRKYLLDPATVSLVKDDAMVLKRLENAMLDAHPSFWEEVKLSGKRALFEDMPRAFANFFISIMNSLPPNLGYGFPFAQREYLDPNITLPEAWERANLPPILGAAPKPESAGFAWDVMSMAGQVAAVTANSVMATLLGGPLAGVAAGSSTMAAYIMGSSYEENRAKGLTHEESLLPAAVNAVAQGALETLRISSIFKLFKTAGRPVRSFVYQWFGTMVESLGVEMLQQFPDWMTRIYAESNLHGETIGERADWFWGEVTNIENWKTEIAEGFAQGKVAAVWAALFGLPAAAHSYGVQAQRKAHTEMRQAAYETMADLVRAAKTAKRDPATMEAFTEEVNAKGDVIGIYLDYEVFQAFEKEHPKEAQNMYKALGIEDQIANAKARDGGDIIIPLSKWQAYAIPEGLDHHFIKHIRWSPDGESVAEVEAGLKAYQTLLMTHKAERVEFEKVPATEPEPEAVKGIRSDLRRIGYDTSEAASAIRALRVLMRNIFRERGEEEAAGWERVALLFRRFKDRAEFDKYLQEHGLPAAPQVPPGEVALGATTKHPKGYLVSILGKADMPALLHELSHVLIHELQDLVESGRASERMQKAFEALREAAGGKFDAKGMEAIAALWQAYHATANAPSLALERAFALFRRALARLYKQHQKAVQLTDEVREALDAIYASEAEIQELAVMQSMQDDWQALIEKTKASEEAKRRVREKRQDVQEKAVARRVARLLNKMRKLRGGIAGMKKAIRERLLNTPFYKALADIIQRGGLNLEDLRAAVPEDRVAGLRKRFKGLAKARSRLSLQAALANSEYENADEFIADLMNAQPLHEAVKTALKAEMEAQLQAARDIAEGMDIPPGSTDMYTQARVDLAEAERAIIAEELARQKKARVRRMSAVARKRAAKAEIRQTKYRDALRVRRYIWTAERYSHKAANAMRDGKLEEALKYKDLELFYLEMVRESIELAKWDRRFRNYVASSQKTKTVAFDAQEQIRALAKRFGLKSDGPISPHERVSLEEWVHEQDQSGSGTPLPIEDWIIPEEVHNYEKLTVEEVQDLRDAISVIRKVGSELASALRDGKTRSYNELARRSAQPASDMASLPVKDQHERLQNAQHLWRSLVAEITTPQLIFRAMDGSPDIKRDGLGFNERVLWGALSRASSRQSGILRRLWAQRLKPLGKRMRAFREEIESQYGKSFDEFNGVPLYVDEKVSKRARQLGISKWDAEKVLTAILNFGNPGNTEAMQAGHGWSDEQVEAIKSGVSSSTWALAQEIGNTCEDFFKPMDDTHLRLRGVRTKKVKVTGFDVTTADGKEIHVDGWYYPLVIDTRFSDRVAQQQADAWLLEQQSYKDSVTRMRGPRSQFTKERKGAKVAPRLALDVFYKHLFDVVHYITHAEVLHDIYRVVKNPEAQEGIRRVFGEEVYDQVIRLLKDTSRMDTRDQLRWGSVWERQRQLAILNLLWGNTNTLLVQPTQIFWGMADLGAWNVAKAAVQVTREVARAMTVRAAARLGMQLRAGDKRGIQFAYESSEYLRNCLTSPDRDIADGLARPLKPLKSEVKIFGVRVSLRDIQDAGMALIGIVDATARVPTWIAAYEHARTQFNYAHDAAVEYADNVAATSNPGPRSIDLSTMQRSTGFLRILTMFLGPSLLSGARFRYFWNAARAGRPGAWKRLLSHVLWEQVAAPMLVTEVLHLVSRGEPADWLELLLGQFRWWASFIPGIAMLVDRRDPNTPVLTGLKKIQRAGRTIVDVVDDPANEDAWWSLLLGAGELGEFWLGVPAIKTIRTVAEGINDLSTGETSNPFRLIVKRPRD